MVMDSDKVAHSSVNYHEGYKVRHPLVQVSNDGRAHEISSCVYYSIEPVLGLPLVRGPSPDIDQEMNFNRV